MKRGFTLVEIIISIALILILGTGSAVFVVNKNKNNNLEKITKEILEAGSAYIKIEKDENGRVLANEVVKGAKGVKVPVSNLVSRGYLDESIKNELYSLEGNPSSTNDYYVMFVQEGGEYCTENEIKGISSWMEKGKDVYLCDEYGTGGDPDGGEPDPEELSFYEQLKLDYSGASTKNKIWANANRVGPSPTYENADYVVAYPNTGDTWIVRCKENGVFKRSDGTYYFRGEVGNNYVRFYHMEDNGLFRIISFNGNEMRLIKENPIESYHYNNASGNATTLPNSRIFKALESWYNYYIGGMGTYYDFNENPNYSSIYVGAYKDIFVNAIFCDGIGNVVSRTIETYGETSIVSSACGHEDSTRFSSPYGLMHMDEAYFAGVYGTYPGGLGFIPTIELYSVFYNNYWLNSGGTTVLMRTGSDYRYDVVLNNFRWGVEGIITSVDEEDDDISPYIRPVIVINPNKVTYDGNGTVNSPYVIKPKALS